MSPEGTEFVQDGTRTIIPDEQRDMHFKKIIEELNKWGLSHTILSGDYKYREIIVENFIKKILPSDKNEETLSYIGDKLNGK